MNFSRRFRTQIICAQRRLNVSGITSDSPGKCNVKAEYKAMLASGMRADRWRDNIHGWGASRLSLKASREISQFLGAGRGTVNETDGDT